LVLQPYCVDEKAEWRTFGSDDETGEHDPNRGGSLSNPLLTHTTLTATISKPAMGIDNATTDVAVSKNWFETIQTIVSSLLHVNSVLKYFLFDNILKYFFYF
jgi:transcription initiation factor TFIIIB Brf1 subunit/transcription initiation factor TFIIB